MSIYISFWVAFNIVFGIFTIKNLTINLVGFLTGRKVNQSNVGVIVDHVTVTSIAAFFIYYYL